MLTLDLAPLRSIKHARGMSQRPPPNQYIVDALSPPDAYERLKHECLREPAAVALLQKLHTSITSTYKDELVQTVKNATQQMLVSAVRVSEKQCPQLQATLARAQVKIQSKFGARAQAVSNAQLYTKQDASVNASSLALPCGSPVVQVTDALVRLLSKEELELVLLHELAHIVYAHSEDLVAMKMKLAVLSDGTLAGTQETQSEMSSYNVLQAGFELTADRTMLACAGADQWPAVLSMFAKLAGGAVGEPLDGGVFQEQLSDLQDPLERTIVEAAIAANPHPPVLYRVQELKRFMDGGM